VVQSARHRPRADRAGGDGTAGGGERRRQRQAAVRALVLENATSSASTLRRCCSLRMRRCSRQSLRRLRTTRSAMSFAFAPRNGISSVWIPEASAREANSLPYTGSRSRRRNVGCRPLGVASMSCRRSACSSTSARWLRNAARRAPTSSDTQPNTAPCSRMEPTATRTEFSRPTAYLPWPAPRPCLHGRTPPRRRSLRFIRRSFAGHVRGPDAPRRRAAPPRHRAGWVRSCGRTTMDRR
jgi:hypothetical protein